MKDDVLEQLNKMGETVYSFPDDPHKQNERCCPPREAILIFYNEVGAGDDVTAMIADQYQLYGISESDHYHLMQEHNVTWPVAYMYDLIM